MPEFSPRRRADPSKAKKKPETAKVDPKKDPSKNALLQSLSRTFGNKQMIEMLTRARFDTSRVDKKAAGPDLMEKFIPPSNPVVAEGVRIFLEQLTAYHEFVGAYTGYVDQIKQHSAFGLFWKYQEPFQNFSRDIVQEVLIRGVDDLGKLLHEQLPDNDKRHDLEKVLQEVHSELRKREKGEDIQKVNQTVSSHTDITKSKDGAELENIISADISIDTPPEDYIKLFLKNHNILLKTLEMRVKDEADKKRDVVLIDDTKQSGAEAGTNSPESNQATPIAAATGANKP